MASVITSASALAFVTGIDFHSDWDFVYNIIVVIFAGRHMWDGSWKDALRFRCLA